MNPAQIKIKLAPGAISTKKQQHIQTVMKIQRKKHGHLCMCYQRRMFCSVCVWRTDSSVQHHHMVGTEESTHAACRKHSEKLQKPVYV